MLCQFPSLVIESQLKEFEITCDPWKILFNDLVSFAQGLLHSPVSFLLYHIHTYIEVNKEGI